jgi:hypothetical protein
MTKKLHITAITSELEGSAFFRRPQHERPAADAPTPPMPENPHVQETQSEQGIPVRMNARAPVRPNGKRIITRNSFEIYEDQMDSLRKISLQEKMEGKLGSMSHMVREAIDAYLKEKSSTR